MTLGILNLLNKRGVYCFVKGHEGDEAILSLLPSGPLMVLNTEGLYKRAAP